MKNKILFLVVVLLSVYAVMSFDDKTHFSMPEKKVKIKNTKKDEIQDIELEEYIVGVVAAEMPASFNIEALKAQAVAARTYAMYKMNNSNKNYDLVTDVSNQSYIDIKEMKEKWQGDFELYYNKVKEAVYNTSGEVIKYEDKIIEAYYFSMSNGYTEDSSLVFNEVKPYLKSVESCWDNEDIKNFVVTKSFSVSEFKSLLNISDSNIVIGNISKSLTNRVNNIVINNKNYSGTEIRKRLNLRSTDFTITINEDIIYVTTKGYGHGVGMSQYGANSMAKEGYNYKEILKYYYNGIEVEKI